MKLPQSFTARAVKGKSPVPPAIGLNPDWGEQFDRQHGLVFKLPKGHWAYLFVDKRLSASQSEDVKRRCQAEDVVAHVVNCEKQEWTVRLEPTAPGRFGFIVYTSSGKPYLSGHGSVNSSGKWRASFKTLFPGIRNTKRCHVVGGIRGGTGQRTEAQIGLSCSK